MAMNDWTPDHHQALANSLLEELQRIAPQTASQAKNSVSIWTTLNPERKRKLLRAMVGSIRDTRIEEVKFTRRRYATTLQIGMEGIEAIYALPPEEALTRAHETIVSMAAATQALKLLAEMGIGKIVNDAAERTSNSASAVATQEGYKALMERLETTVAGGLTLLLTYLSRGGGHELTNEERIQMKEAFDEVRRLSAANAAT